MISPPHRSARRGGCSRNALLSSQTTGAEEIAKQSGRLRGTCFVLNDFGAPVTGRLFEKSWPVHHCPALFVSRSKDQPPNPREADRAGAHRTRLERDVEGRASQSVIPRGLTCRTNGGDLCMSGRVMRRDGLVTSLTQHSAGFGIADNRPDRDFSCLSSEARQVQSALHHVMIPAHQHRHTPKRAFLHRGPVLWPLPMRIISGRFKGQPLAAPKGRNTRPTSDRARESLFNVLTHASWAPPLEGARVIDLFAGSGALGFEAMSRGAAFCLFVETDSAARGTIRDNVEAFQLFGNTRIHRRSATDLGPKPAGVGSPFTIAFLDPPYHQGLVTPCLDNLLAGQWLAADAIAVVETDAKETFDHDGWEVLDEREAGKAKLTILKPA